MYDVVCYGALCADNVIHLPRFPNPGDGVRATSDALVPGGNALNEARCLALWGRRVALLGDALGDDPEGDMLFATIAATTQIDGRYLQRAAGARTPLCRIMITPDGQRTILAVRSPDHPATTLPRELLDACSVVSVTRFGAGTVAAAQRARAAGKLLVIGDALMLDEPFAALADVIVGSVAYLQDTTAIEAHLRRLHALRGATVIVTDGPRPVHALIAGTLHTFTPAVIAPVDTTGAGDCFRAGITYGLSQRWNWQDTIRWATAAGTAWCLNSDNTPPTLDAVRRLLA